MVKRCHVCREFTEQRCARCEERCCDTHIYCSRVGGKDLCLACKKQLEPEKAEPPDMFEKGAVVGIAVVSGIAVSGIAVWELGVPLCFSILGLLARDPSVVDPESKSARRRRMACSDAGTGAAAAAETSPILKFPMGVLFCMAIIPFTWMICNLFVCTCELVLHRGTRAFDECIVPLCLNHWACPCAG